MNEKLLRDNVPQEMKEAKRWVIYGKEGKLDKTPYQPKNGFRASKTDPAHWDTFEAAIAAAKRYKMAGIGFVISKPYIGLDLDHCINDGQLAPYAREIVKLVNSYTEISPSGTGIHIIAKGQKPSWAGTKKKNVNGSGSDLEMYDCQYFTVTGKIL